MALYTRRIQATLTEEQYRELQRLARARHITVSELVRQTLEQQYFEGPAIEQRREALADLLSLRSPVTDWPEMEAEILRGALEQ
jgi:hypothetical protein